MLRMTEPIHKSGRVVILDSGFCVLQGIIELRKKGVYASALIKKRQYWPKYIPGDDVKAHFADKQIGDVDAWPGELDGVPFHIFAMKEPDYTMMLMSTYGTNTRVGEMKKRDVENGQRLSFMYPEVVANHYWFRDAVDSNNARRMQPISIEETWATTRWPLRVFAYLLGTSVVNANLAYCNIEGIKPVLDEMSFRKELAEALIFNPYLGADERKMTGDIAGTRRKRQHTEHKLVGLGPYEKFNGSGNIVPCNTKYGSWVCRCPGKKKTRCTYCQCSPGTIYCVDCFATHIADVAAEDALRDVYENMK